MAAGQGSRLRPLTDDRPKCLVQVMGKPIIEHALAALAAAGIEDVVVVTGYRADKLDYLPVTKVLNPDFETTNMVHSLFCAESELNGDVLIVYGDILFNPRIIRTLAADASPIAVAVNSAWLDLWAERMESPLDDAETLKLNPDGTIRELGKKPRTLADVEGQYMGLIRMRTQVLPAVRAFYHSLDRAARYDGKAFPQMFMTSFLQAVIDRLMPIRAVSVSGGWLEIDTPQDAEHAERRGAEILVGAE